MKHLLLLLPIAALLSSCTSAIKKLQGWAKTNGWKTKDQPFFAIYDPPWIPEIMRRNKVWLHVEVPGHKHELHEERQEEDGEGI